MTELCPYYVSLQRQDDQHLSWQNRGFATKEACIAGIIAMVFEVLGVTLVVQAVTPEEPSLSQE